MGRGVGRRRGGDAEPAHEHLAYAALVEAQSVEWVRSGRSRQSRSFHSADDRLFPLTPGIELRHKLIVSVRLPAERRTEMRKVITGAFVSLDGVMQAPGGPKEDPTRGFRLGGWVVPYMDEVFGQAINEMFGQPFDLLLGRKTYEIFAAHWPYAE